jgi:hypothetical protein
MPQISGDGEAARSASRKGGIGFPVRKRDNKEAGTLQRF